MLRVGSCGSYGSYDETPQSGKIVIDSKRGQISQFNMNRSKSLHQIKAVDNFTVPKKDLHKFYEQHNASQSTLKNYQSMGVNIDSVHKVDEDIRNKINGPKNEIERFSLNGGYVHDPLGSLNKS